MACIPQASPAAAPLLLLQAMLGVVADVPARALRTERPMLPDGLGEIRLEGLRVGHATVSLGFERAGAATAFTLLEQHGKLNVTMATGE